MFYNWLQFYALASCSLAPKAVKWQTNLPTQIHAYACEGTVATPSPAENFGILRNIQKLGTIIKVVYNILPYFYVVGRSNYIKYGRILYTTFIMAPGFCIFLRIPKFSGGDGVATVPSQAYA